MESLSLRPLLTNPCNAKWDKPAVSQVWHNPNAWGYSLRTPRYRYTEWLAGAAGIELYDHDNDPDEVHNLAGKSEHQALVAKLKALLEPYTKHALP